MIAGRIHIHSFIYLSKPTWPKQAHKHDKKMKEKNINMY